MSTTIEHPCVLVVEGKDEERFFKALLGHLQIRDVQVLGIGGKTNLKANLKALALTPNFKQVVRVAVVRDADSDRDAAFQSVCDALTAAGFAAPPSIGVRHGGSPIVAVLILPETGTGALEDVCLAAVLTDPVVPCLAAYFDCIRPIVGSPRHVGKAKIQAFLASRREEGKRLGEAAEAGYWPWDENAFRFIRDFLQLITT
jgi:hypothetical protein